MGMTLRNAAAFAAGLMLFRIWEVVVPGAPVTTGEAMGPEEMRIDDPPADAGRMVPTLFGFGAIGHEGGVDGAIPSLPGREDEQGADDGGFPANGR